MAKVQNTKAPVRRVEEEEKQKIKRAKESLSKKDADIDFELAEIEIKQALTRMKVKKHRLG